MNIKYAALLLAAVMIVGLSAGCGTTTEPVAVSAEKTSAAAVEEVDMAPVTLTVAGGWTDCRALDVTARAFKAKYPNCTIVYEYLQDYYASVEKRMTGEAAVDLFFTTNIQEGSAMLPYALDLKSCESLDLSDTFDGLIENFTYHKDTDDAGYLYAIPLGAEMRGLYINKTLLDSLNISIPTNQATLLAACKTLKAKGYIPFQGNPGSFAQTLMYPWICNTIANADDPEAAYAKVAAREPGLSKMFSEPYAFLYELVKNGYYDYKKAQTELDLFNETTDESYARYFFNIVKRDGAFVKADDVGRVAFMLAPMSLQSVIDKTKNDYHSKIEYVFVPAPIGKNGGYAYLSPAHGIAANKNSANVEWVVKFLDFLFQPENNKAFASEFNVIPNTKEAFSYISSLYDTPDKNISHLGQVTFNYRFYAMMVQSLTELSKANNPQYMKTGEDGAVTMYPLEYYLERLEESVKAQ